MRIRNTLSSHFAVIRNNMSSSFFCFFLFCFQACLIQNVYSQCLGRVGPGGPSLGPYGGPLGGPGYGPVGYGGCGGYGGSGIGNVAVAGELPVAGSAAVLGQVPVIGAVEFAGPACAVGSVSISGACGPTYSNVDQQHFRRLPRFDCKSNNPQIR